LSSLEFQPGLDWGRGKSSVTSTGLTEFLLARIAEDEAAANAVKDVGADVWNIDVIYWSLDLHPLVTSSTDGDRTRLAQHFDPARVLAGCAADRLIVAIHRAYQPCGEVSPPGRRYKALHEVPTGISEESLFAAQIRRVEVFAESSPQAKTSMRQGQGLA
jgi:Family of unknown function (DUF6221)